MQRFRSVSISIQGQIDQFQATADKQRRTQDENIVETQYLTWKTPSKRREKTTGASQQTLFTIIKS
jgi:hypothetical protein